MCQAGMLANRRLTMAPGGVMPGADLVIAEQCDLMNFVV